MRLTPGHGCAAVAVAVLSAAAAARRPAAPRGEPSQSGSEVPWWTTWKGTNQPVPRAHDAPV